MKKETLKDWIKNWSIEDIVGDLVSVGMQYMAEGITTDDLKKHKAVAVREINKRIKLAKDTNERYE